MKFAPVLRWLLVWFLSCWGAIAPFTCMAHMNLSVCGAPLSSNTVYDGLGDTETGYDAHSEATSPYDTGSVFLGIGDVRAPREGCALSGLRAGFLAANTTARTFASTDPLVADLANKIEAMYPGHVLGVNVPLYDAGGNLLTDADILLKNSVIQVKSGASAQGMLRQLQRSEAATGLPSIGFGPNLPGNSLRALSQQGGLVTGDENLLLQVVKP